MVTAPDSIILLQMEARGVRLKQWEQPPLLHQNLLHWGQAQTYV